MPGTVDYKLVEPVSNDSLEVVSDLTDPNKREWRLEIITEAFGTVDAERILHIPFAIAPHEDDIIWRGEALGEFSMRSAYKLLQRDSYFPTINSTQHESNFYKRLWNTRLPRKLQILVWRASLKFLPTMANLFIRRLVSNTLCPRCEKEPESVEHLYRTCPESMAVWGLTGFQWALRSDIMNWDDWLTWMAEGCSSSSFRKFCCVLWTI